VVGSTSALRPSLRSFESDALLERFCPTVEQPWRELRRLEGAMGRSCRARNPRASIGAQEVEPFAELPTTDRAAKTRARLAAEHKGELANRILARERKALLPRLPALLWPVREVRGVGRFIADLKRKTRACGGEVIEFSAARTHHERAARTCERDGVPPPYALRCVRAGRPSERRRRSRGRRRRGHKARAPEDDRQADAQASAPPLITPRICSWRGLVEERGWVEELGFSPKPH